MPENKGESIEKTARDEPGGSGNAIQQYEGIIYEFCIRIVFELFFRTIIR